jgi:hypothetical protein
VVPSMLHSPPAPQNIQPNSTRDKLRFLQPRRLKRHVSHTG